MLNSRYFTLPEFACKSGEPYPTEWVDTRLQRLCGVLDELREAWGGPLHIVSGYRSAAFNAKLREHSSGVAQNSQHIQGTAADVAPADPTNVAAFIDLVTRKLAAGELSALGGFGRYPGWAHIDVRERPADGHIARWDGVGFGSEPVA